MSTRKWAVIGAGPVGGIVAMHLAQAGEEVFVVEVKDDIARAVASSGIKVSNLKCADGGNPDAPQPTQDEMTASPAATVKSIGDLAALAPDTVIIATKTSALPQIIEELSSMDASLKSFVVMQNGIDNEEAVAERFGRDRTFRIVVNYAGGIVSPGHLKMTFFHRPNHIGACDPSKEPEAREIEDILTRIGLETAYSPEVKQHEWVKTILNAGLSPVCAISKLRMSEAMTFPPVRSITETILKEGIAVAKAAGYDPGPDFFDKGITYLATAGPHKPSMMIDIETGVPTEVDFITQKIIDYGEKHQVPTPTLRAVTNFVRGLELANSIAEGEKQ